MILEKAVEDLLDCFVKVLNDTEKAADNANNETLGYLEREICAGVSEKLQGPKYIVVNEAPYPIHRRSHADLKIRYGRDKKDTLWVEFKPLYERSGYWRYSKFFNGQANKTHIYSSNSIILNDIDKMDLLENEDDAFAFVFLYPHDNEEDTKDKNIPTKGRLSAANIRYLCLRRFEHLVKDDYKVKTKAKSNDYYTIRAYYI